MTSVASRPRAAPAEDFRYFHARVIQQQNEFFSSPISPSLSSPSDPPPTPPIELDQPSSGAAKSIQSIALPHHHFARPQSNRCQTTPTLSTHALEPPQSRARPIITEPLPETVTCNIVPSGFDTDLAAGTEPTQNPPPIWNPPPTTRI